MTFQQQFAERVIALTGAASGIGLSTAHLLAQRGAILSIADLNQEALDKVKSDLESKYNTKVLATAVDVRKYDQVEQWIQKTVQEFGALHGGANVAGVVGKQIGTVLVDQDLDDFDFLMDVNVKGVLHCMKAQLRVVAEGGAVVNAGSIAGLIGRDTNSSYSASKHAVHGLTKSAAKEVGIKNVRVNAVCPGRIDTPMAKNAAAIAAGGPKSHVSSTGITGGVDYVALRRVGEAEEVAKLIAFLLSDESSYITGQCIAIDGRSTSETPFKFILTATRWLELLDVAQRRAEAR